MKNATLALENTWDLALRRRAQMIFDALALKSTDHVLDAGGGDGFYSKLLAPHARRVTLLEFDRRAIDSAVRNGVPSSDILHGSVTNIPLGSASVDKIVLTEVLEHVPDESLALQEIHRVLRPGGTLVVTVPNVSFPFLWDPPNWVMQNLFKRPIREGFWAGIWYGHLRLYTPDELRTRLGRAGFNVANEAAVTHHCLPFNHHALNLGARYLASGKAPARTTAALSKFEAAPTHRPWFLRASKRGMEWVDRRNDKVGLDASSVSILAVATKS